MEIKKGNIYWVSVFDENGQIRSIIHPQVVIQDTVINNSRIETIVVCGLTTNMKKAYEPGNILLDNGEGNLIKRSIVVVSHISVVQKKYFNEYIGNLNKDRLNQIFHGMKLIQSSSNRN